eukprot:gene26326-32892_t
MWAADIPAMVLAQNLYGSYPYYVQLNAEGQAHGVLLMNSNGMDVTLHEEAITFKVIGGIIDLYIFSGPSPAAVVQQYTELIGRPAMMPYWVKAFVEDLHAKGMHFVPIIDPGIAIIKGYEAYERGIREDLFIKDVSGAYSMGQVWPGPTYFPDFTHPKSQSFWTDQLTAFHKLAALDAPGAAFTDCCLVCSQVDASNVLDYPPYRIHNTYGKLSTRTLSVSGTLYKNVSLYDIHNMYGLTEQIATYNALVDITKKRPFVLSRSSFMSTGVHSAKWTGDNGATWGNLQSSVVSLMDYSLFGVPMIGADICGFMLNTTEELCNRWISVGAFYPFSRAHNTHTTEPQELYLWDSVASAAKHALSDSLLISPVLEKGEDIVNAYFPQGLWYNYLNHTVDINATSSGQYKDLYTPLGAINVH